MVVAAAVLLFAGFVLLYAGIKGVHVQAPWKLVADWMHGGSGS